MAIIHVRLPWEDHRVASFAARWLMATRLAATTFATATAPIRWTDIGRRVICAPRLSDYWELSP